jgi:hypothetical protein
MDGAVKLYVLKAKQVVEAEVEGRGIKLVSLKLKRIKYAPRR